MAFFLKPPRRRKRSMDDFFYRKNVVSSREVEKEITAKKKMMTNKLLIAVTIGDYQNQLHSLLGIWSFAREEREKAVISQSRPVRLIVKETRLEVEREGRIEKRSRAEDVLSLVRKVGVKSGSKSQEPKS